jgi:hypothetical protein
VRKRQPLTS